MSSRRTYQRSTATIRERSGRDEGAGFSPRPDPASLHPSDWRPEAPWPQTEAKVKGAMTEVRLNITRMVSRANTGNQEVHLDPDWRSELCRFLNLPNYTSDSEIFEALTEAEEKLEEAERLKYQYTADPGPPRSQVMHEIHCHRDQIRLIYQDEPWLVESGPYHAHLRGSRPVANLELYLERNKNISFLVFREYECCHRHTRRRHTIEAEESTATDASLFFSKEYIDLISPELRNALTVLSSKLTLGGNPNPPLFEDERSVNISHPYLWWCHHRDEISTEKPRMDPMFQQHVDVVQAYIEDRLRPEWDVVDELTAKGKITVDLLRYLFVPNHLIISQTRGTDISQLNGLITRDWLSVETFNKDAKDFKVSILADSWEFDGSFHKTTTLRRLNCSLLQSRTESFDITSLPIYPAHFAKKSILEGLRGRGKMFWSCRRRKYVSYIKDTDDAAQSTNGSRFMIDLETYNKMHPPSQPPQEPKSSRKPPNPNEILKVDMMSEKPPEDDNFLMCLPSTMKGFDMNTKTWSERTHLSKSCSVWNREAFEDLVIEPKTKDLVKAVVMNRLASEESTDLIQGKGNGLFILLHGVAEIAEKPLYKVTCGDVGTKPDEVEKYLEVVTLLGKTWGCVVLLDEADVFLEQRSLANLKRNALVSVFLRVLEYYDGILILTTNRVGTFDEAFKSRIQLNLRYNKLDEDKRLKIWNNFITRLELRTHKGHDKSSHDYGINSDSIRSKLQALAAENLNGREIRNAISTARQLASFKREAMDYGHLSSVITEANNFEQYLVNLHKGHSADEIQHDIEAR
ncbi:putative ATPase [Colletotrichum sublineola]|uniref:Putative ATPase n=1 Tax=Colletotrichum sublineola TaxID=1173701 RepID=A0A066XI65_COLSU|nr:putative ATPase [Colletotrichum sublineola]